MHKNEHALLSVSLGMHLLLLKVKATGTYSHDKAEGEENPLCAHSIQIKMVVSKNSWFVKELHLDTTLRKIQFGRFS
jgi:hypothetical protein